MTDVRVEPFAPHHDRSHFSCGVPALDEFVRTQISQYERRGLGRSYVIADNSRVIGYYTLAAGAIEFRHLPPESARRLPRHPVPVVLLGRLAVDQSHQDKGLGAALLKDALVRSAQIAKELGAYAIHVEALSDDAVAFYQHFGFLLSPRPRSLFLSIAAIPDN